eukprot:2475245-Rhodomonas_salina.2
MVSSRVVTRQHVCVGAGSDHVFPRLRSVCAPHSIRTSGPTLATSSALRESPLPPFPSDFFPLSPRPPPLSLSTSTRVAWIRACSLTDGMENTDSLSKGAERQRAGRRQKLWSACSPSMHSLCNVRF